MGAESDDVVTGVTNFLQEQQFRSEGNTPAANRGRNYSPRSIW